MIVSDGIRFPREGGLEIRQIAGDILQRGNDLVSVGHAHFPTGQNRPLGLFFDVGGASIPELGDVQRRIVDGGRIAADRIPAVPKGEA